VSQLASRDLTLLFQGTLSIPQTLSCTHPFILTHFIHKLHIASDFRDLKGPGAVQKVLGERFLYQELCRDFASGSSKAFPPQTNNKYFVKCFVKFCAKTAVSFSPGIGVIDPCMISGMSVCVSGYFYLYIIISVHI